MILNFSETLSLYMIEMDRRASEGFSTLELIEIVRELNDDDYSDMTTLTAFLLLGFTMLKNGLNLCPYLVRH
jgi:hypothetical protein